MCNEKMWLYNFFFYNLLEVSELYGYLTMFLVSIRRYIHFPFFLNIDFLKCLFQTIYKKNVHTYLSSGKKATESIAVFEKQIFYLFK